MIKLQFKYFNNILNFKLLKNILLKKQNINIKTVPLCKLKTLKKIIKKNNKKIKKNKKPSSTPVIKNKQ